MSAAQTVIGELDVVALLTPVDGWPIATSGTVISDHQAHKLVEISDHLGQELDLLYVPTEDLRLVCKWPGEGS